MMSRTRHPKSRPTGWLLLTLLLPADVPASTPRFEDHDCEALGLIDFGDVRLIEAWRPTQKRYAGSEEALRLVRLYRQLPSGEVGNVQVRNETHLCYGDRLELWHDARAFVDQRDIASRQVIRTLRVEGGAVIELGSTIRQFRGATTYSLWDRALEEHAASLVVEVGTTGSGVARADSTFRLEVEDACQCKVRLAVSRRDDPLSASVESDRHSVVFVGRNAEGAPVEERILGGEAVIIDLSDQASPDQPARRALPAVETAEVQQKLVEAHEQLTAPLVAQVRAGSITARPVLSAYVAPSRVRLRLDVEGDIVPAALHLDGEPVQPGGWAPRVGGWTVELDRWLVPGEHVVRVTLPGAAAQERPLTVDRTTRVLDVRFSAGVVSAGGEGVGGGPTGRVITTRSVPNAPLELVELSGGTFQMGSPEGEWYDNERPQHAVTVSGFAIGRSEVTQAQWAAVVTAAQAAKDPDAAGLEVDPSSFKGAKLPVEQVSWCDAARFANALSGLEDRTPAYTVGSDCESGGAVAWDRAADGYRLPTEAEWEYAARAGTTTAYATGNTEADLARAGWYDGNSGSKTHAVCTAEAKPWGLCDLHGNVWEWVWDVYDSGYYGKSPAADPVGPADRGGGRVLRGGSWDYSPGDARSANRSWYPPSGADWDVGFRLVLPVAVPEPG